MTSYATGSVLLAVGTQRGLLVIISSRDREHWQLKAARLETQPSRIYYAVFDPRNSYRLFSAENGDSSGPALRYSDDFGASWREPARGLQFARDSREKLEDIWYIEPGPRREPGLLYAGTDPASLWISRDAGESWDINPGLQMMPERAGWPRGAGGTCLHSILFDANNPDRLWVGISGAGCLRTDDGGRTWRPINRLAGDQGGEVGAGSHRLIQHPTQPDLLYQQNREGTFKSLDAGESWQPIHQELPSLFGFPLALDVHHPETLFTVVLDPRTRFNVGNAFVVHRSQDGGEHWEALTHGLPAGPQVRLKVLRHALCTDALDPCGVYVGTTSGQLFASHDRGNTWQLIADYLPPIYSVTATLMA